MYDKNENNFKIKNFSSMFENFFKLHLKRCLPKINFEKIKLRDTCFYFENINTLICSHT